MTLYAFVKSNNIPVTCIPLSIAPYVISRTDWVAVSVDIFTLKPFWASVNMLFFVIKDINLLHINFSNIFEEPIEVILFYNSVHNECPLCYKRVLLQLFSTCLEKYRIQKKHCKYDTKGFNVFYAVFD
jgi:hypothetical protein